MGFGGVSGLGSRFAGFWGLEFQVWRVGVEV